MKNIFKVNGKFYLFPFLISILIPLGGSTLIAYLTRNSMNVYSEVIVPFFAPPSWVFIVVWPILDFFMGVGSYRIYCLNVQGVHTASALFFYYVQLLLNFLWSFIFFSFKLYGLAFIELIILFIFAIITFIKFYKIDKLSGILLLPYIFWLVFASTLNFYIWKYNEM